jgi:class 3 adenylate cyclase
MVSTARLDVLHALIGTTAGQPLDGTSLMGRLRSAGRPQRADRLLRVLLELEEVDHVRVEREPQYRFGLTPTGEAAAYDLGPGTAVELTVVMIDLVDFVAFTEAHGDAAGLNAALQMAEIARGELTSAKGQLVKHLGDGVLGSLPTGVDPLPALEAVARRCEQPDGTPWPIRASARLGRPIVHGSDLYGADVNLAARLCAAAEPGQVVLSGFPAIPPVEDLAVRGRSTPVPIRRVALR